MRSSDNAFINQFENLFIALNEHGQVAAWRLTRSTAFKEVENLLRLKIMSRCEVSRTTHDYGG